MANTEKNITKYCTTRLATKVSQPAFDIHRNLLTTQMKRLLSINPFLFQLTTTFFVLYAVFLLLFATKGAHRAGLSEGLGFENSKAIYAIIIVFITIGLCLFFGLPIRIIPGFRNWWTQKPMLCILLLVIGLTLIALSANSFFSNTYPILTGWFLTAFSLLHFYPITFLKKTNTNMVTNQSKETGTLVD